MRFHGEVSCSEDEEDKETKEVFPLPGSIEALFPQAPKLVVGYALTSKKKESFLQPRLLGLARDKGIFFVAIDQSRSLLDQGPFDVVLHKLSGKEWCQIIEDYREKHPEVTILDPPDAIKHVTNRRSMLEDVADLNLANCDGTVVVPRQLVITREPSSIPDEVTKAGLEFPLVVKPLVVDGSAKSHGLFLAYDQFSIAELEPPLVLQEFVNHGGILFKVYVVGEAIRVVRRFSLPDVGRWELSKFGGIVPFPRVSSAAASADDVDLDPAVSELPPEPLLERLSRDLRCRLGLRLFNVDMIRKNGTRDLYYVIDINYFPGTLHHINKTLARLFEALNPVNMPPLASSLNKLLETSAGFGKVPEYEHIFTDFLLSLIQSKQKK